MELARASMLVGEFEAEAFGFGEHANDAALGGLGGAADEFGFELYLVAAFGGGFADFGAEDGFVEAELLRDAGRPFGAKKAIGNFLNVGEKEIDGVALPFSGGEIHAARAGDEVIDVGRRLFQEFDVGVFALLADEFVGIGFAGEREDADFEVLFEQKRDASVRWRFGRRCRGRS